MFQLSVQDIHPGEKAGDKEEAIRQVAAALVQAGNVAEGYVNGMLAREQQTSTFLGNGIAIPHGTTDTRDQVLKTGVQVFQFPEGVTWGDGQVAYVAIGIAASSDEHLGLLRQLTHVLSDDSVAEQLKSATTAEELRALLMGEKQSEQLKLDNEMLTLDIVASDLLTLQALNAARLKEAGAVDATFREKDYVVIIGSANIDVAGYSHESLNYADSNPGKIKFTPGGVGRNIAQNLALLGNKAWLLSAVGSDFYGQSLLTQTNQSGVYVDKCLIVPGENTSSYLSLLDNTGEMLVAINDMNISNAITAEYLAQHREFIQRAKVIVADCNISEEALAWILDNAANVPVFVDPVSAWKCVKVRDRLNQIHTLKPNRLEAETLSGIALSGRDDVAKVAAWFHQHGLNRLVLSMGGDGVYYSDISGENGWSAPIKTNVINVTGAGDAMMAGLASCWVDGMPFAESVRFAQGCSSMALSCEYTNNPDLSIANVISLVENAECLN